MSPTFFNQEATVPSSMVSLRRGIVIISTFSGNATSSFDSSGAAASVFTTGVSPLKCAEISSPLLPMIAKRVSTGAVPPS